jgi:septal ring-binding cell division protein DamX
MVQERRQFARIAPRAPLVISIGESKPGLLLDVCEGGVAVASLEPRSLEEVISITFDLPEGNGHICAEGEVAWTRDSGHLTGVRFLDLADDSRRQLEAWVSIHAALQTASAAVAADEPDRLAKFKTTETPSQVLEPEPAEHEQAAGLPSFSFIHRELGSEQNKSGLVLREASGLDSSSRYPIRIFMAIILLSWALVFLGYRMGSTEMNPRTKEAASIVDASETKSTGSPKSSERPVHSQASPHAASLSNPGVVLQVGAMKEEANADALALALQKKNFPTFVFQRGPGQLYKVAVGPYSAADMGTAAKVKEDLQKQGLKSIVKPWLPE